MVDNWYDDITSGHGASSWQRDGFYENGNIVDSDFTDASVQAWGNDCANDRVDEPDAALVALHGGISTGRWYGLVRVNEPGPGNCRAWQGHMRFGNCDLEFLHLSSCHSMNRDTWWPEWSQSFRGLHQIDGFHGVMYIVRAYGHRYGGFSDDAFDTSIASAWLDNLYKYRSRGNNQCPVARGVGFGSADLWDRMDHERYNGPYSDPVGAGTGGVIYISGCDPEGQPALPH